MNQNTIINPTKPQRRQRSTLYDHPDLILDTSTDELFEISNEAVQEHYAHWKNELAALHETDPEAAARVLTATTELLAVNPFSKFSDHHEDFRCAALATAMIWECG